MFYGMPIAEIILILDVLLTVILLFQLFERRSKRTHVIIFAVFVAFILVAFFGIKYASKSLRPIFYGVVIAYLFKPMCNVFYTKLYNLFSKKRTPAKAKKLAHYLSIVCTYVVWGVILSVLLAAVLPKIVSAVLSFGASIPSFISYLMALVNRLAEENEFIREFLGETLEELQEDLTGFYDILRQYLQPLASGVFGMVAESVTFLFNVIVGFIVSVYLLLGRKKLGAQSKLLVKSVFGPKWSAMIFDEVKFADKMFSGYFVGSMIDSAVVGVICYISCLIMHTPYAVLVSVIVTFTNLIPFFGPYIGMIPSALIILSRSPVHALMFVIMLWLLQQIDGNIMAPKIIGSNTGLSSFWVLFAILLFGGLFGFFGMIIGVPIFAVIYDICGKLMRFCLKKRGEDDELRHYENEFLTEEASPPSMMERLRRKRQAADKAGVSEVVQNDNGNCESSEVLENISDIAVSDDAADDEDSERDKLIFHEHAENKKSGKNSL